MGSNDEPYWEVTPPTVKSFSVSTTGSDILSGTGTSDDPYIIAYNGSLVLTLSGSKNKTDANSSLQYNTSGSWNTTTSRTISGITSTTKTYVTVKMRCYNSTASLSGTESSKTIYYKSEASYNVTAAKTPSAGGSVTPTSATKMGTTSGGNITATPSTGYNFSSWAITSGSGYFGESGTATTSETANTKFRPTAASTVTATFTPKTYSITLDGNGGSDGSATATYNSSTLTSVTHCSRASYDLKGYYTATSDGTKVINANGTLVASVSGYTNSSSEWIYDDDVELHAQWTYNPVTYSVTYAVGTGYTSYGSLSAANTSTSAAISSGSSVESGTGVTFTASPNAHYKVAGWYSDASCSSAIAGAGTGTTYSTTISANTTVYVKFVLIQTALTLNLHSGSGSTAVTATHGSALPSFTAATRTGYTLQGYYTAESSGTKIINANKSLVASVSGYTDGSSKWIYTGTTLTLHAQWSEVMSSLSTSCHYDVGNPSYSAPTVSGSATTVGYETTRSITAAAAGTGYRFVGWTLTNCTRTDGGGATANPITIRSNGDGAAATVVANYEEVLTQSTWIVSGGNKIVTSGTTWRTTADANNSMVKKTGHSTESVVYFTVPVTTVCSGDNNGNFQFKIYNTSTSTWYSLAADGSSYYLLKAEDGTAKSLVTDGKNIELRAYVTGDYEFKLDYSSTPTLTVTWPVINQVRISAASPTDATNTGNFDLSDPVSNVRSVKRTLNASTTYTFKVVYNSDFYGYNSGTFTRSTSTSSNSRTISTSGGDMTLTTDYAGDYTFKFNQSTKALSVDFPTAYKITFGKGSVDGTTGSFSAVDLDNGSSAVTSNSTWVKSGDKVKITAPSAKSGYRFLGWYDNNSATGDAITTLANCTITVNTTKTVYACYAENLTSITVSAGTGGTVTTGSGTSNLGVTTTKAINASANPGYTWSTWTISGTAALGKTATTASNTAKGDGTNGSTGTITATFTPNPYTITLNKHNGQSNGSISVTFDSNTNLTGTAVTAPTKTGYTFGGYYTGESGAGTKIINADGTVVASASDASYTYTDASKNWKYPNNITLHAKWTAKTSALTFDYQTSATGYGSSGSISAVSATYDAAMPTLSGSMPTAANGYAFMGFYDGTGGSGTQYYDGTGASVNNWDKDKTTGTTLYAYYKKAEITAITLDAAVVEASGTVSFAVTVSPTPVGDTKTCFTILHSNDNPLAEQPTVTYNGGTGKYSFTAPAASGTYKIETVLKTGSSCAGGTELDTEVASFQVAGLHTVTVRYKCGDEVIKASTTATGRPLDWSDAMTAPDIFGYTFANWTAGDGVTLTDDNGTTTKTTTTAATIKIKAIYDGSLTANYNQNAIIYFKNTLGWSDVYVNFLGEWGYWTTDKGSGNNGVTNQNKHMTQIDDTDIWYYDYGAESISPSLYVSFTSASQVNAENFWAENPGINVVYPANYPDAYNTDKSSENGFKAATPMFVPLATQNGVTLNSSGGGKANYYNAGYWTKYTPGTGYTLEIYNSAGNVLLKSVEFTSEDELMPMKAVVDLEAGQTYKYQLRRGGTDSYGIYYGNSGTMTYSNHGQGTAWALTNSPSFSMCGITTNAAGDYTFNLSYSANASTEYRLRMAVDYPIANGDYRVIYYDNVKPYWKPSAIVPKVNNGKDTVSFFIRPGSTPYMKIQQSSVNASTGAITWNDYYSVSTGTLTALAKDSVYNVCIAMNGSGGATVENIVPYTGNYYIRVDAANSKWDNYRSDPDHLMTYSEYSITHGGYSHYYCHWVNASDSRKNVKFCIANDYSPCISDTLTRETASGTWANIETYIDSNGDLIRNANVRFMWNRHDNTISRAYVDGAQDDGSRFLVISSTDGKIKKADGSALSNNEVTFSDNENWIYEANVQAQPEAQIKLKSTWGTSNTIEQYFKGSSTTTEQLIGGSGSTWYDIRILYDFKTNRLIASYIPVDENIETEKAIEADIMFIREHQGDIAQLTFGESGKISKIETAYGVIRFNKWTLANKDKSTHTPLASPASIYERSLFWISFPFKVKLSEVFGFGKYGEHWAIQYYDGAKRAEIGHFAENGSFWKWMSRNTDYLEPDQGYLLAIDLDLLGESSDVWGPASRSEQIELYFPSFGTMPDITNADVVQTIPGHACTINWAATQGLPDTGDPRTSYNRTIFDSHWNVMSVPTYVNTDDVSFANTTWTGDHPSFLYTWNEDDNTITATSASGYTFHAMHAYMVQYGGNITWSANSGSPAGIVARRTYAEKPSKVEFRLELQQNEKMIDRTYVALSDDEEVSAGFKFGEDMTKEYNRKSSIYTFIPGEAVVAGNTLPMSKQTTIVPVGVDIKADGDYTFAIPDGTTGIGVTLIDNETGIRTSLSALDYAVFLEAGTYDERFVLEISAVLNTPTDIINVQGDDGQGTKARKMMIDGIMYIVKDGKLFDAHGARVQ